MTNDLSKNDYFLMLLLMESDAARKLFNSNPIEFWLPVKNQNPELWCRGMEHMAVSPLKKRGPKPDQKKDYFTALICAYRAFLDDIAYTAAFEKYYPDGEQPNRVEIKHPMQWYDLEEAFLTKWRGRERVMMKFKFKDDDLPDQFEFERLFVKPSLDKNPVN